MSTEERKAVVRQQIEQLFNHGDLDAAEVVYTPDYVGHEPTSLLTSRDIQGVEGAKQFAAEYHEAFPDLVATIEDQIAEGDKVVTRWTVRGTHRGELDATGIVGTGNRLHMSGITISRIEGDKIAEEWTNYDSFGMMQQLGIVSLREVGA